MEYLKEYEFILLAPETSGFHPGPDVILEIGTARLRLEGMVSSIQTGHCSSIMYGAYSP